MRRRSLWILAGLLVLVVGGGVALVLTQKPSLDDARGAVDARWEAVRPALEARYEKLDAARASFVGAAGGERSVSTDLQKQLATWRHALKDGGPGAQAEAANSLEAGARRLGANVLGSPRLVQDHDLLGAIAAFSGSAPDPKLVDAYNRAVHDYEDARTDSVKRPVALVFGFAERPLLVVGAQ
jgi:hypothetical protein